MRVACTCTVVRRECWCWSSARPLEMVHVEALHYAEMTPERCVDAKPAQSFPNGALFS